MAKVVQFPVQHVERRLPAKDALVPVSTLSRGLWITAWWPFTLGSGLLLKSLAAGSGQRRSEAEPTVAEKRLIANVVPIAIGKSR